MGSGEFSKFVPNPLKARSSVTLGFCVCEARDGNAVRDSVVLLMGMRVFLRETLDKGQGGVSAWGGGPPPLCSS